MFSSIVHVKTPGALGKLEDRRKDMVFLGNERGTKGYWCFDPTTHKVRLSRDIIFVEECKWNFKEEQASEGMPIKEFCASSVDLRFENPSERMEEGGANI